MKTYTVEQIKEAGADANIHAYYVDELIKNLDDLQSLQQTDVSRALPEDCSHLLLMREHYWECQICGKKMWNIKQNQDVTV